MGSKRPSNNCLVHFYKSRIQPFYKQSVRKYFKPKHTKEAFYDVEGVVTKDTILFRYDDPSRLVMKRNVAALALVPVWGWVGYNTFVLKSTVEPLKERQVVTEDARLQWLLNNVSLGSRGLGVAFFLFGAALSSYYCVRTLYTLKRIVLKKGGKYVAFQTYGLLGTNSAFFNVPVVHCSGTQPFKNQLFFKDVTFFVKVRDHSFRYRLNLEDGTISNRPLFNRTIGQGRTV